jgi:transcriptional regulator with XRE-family HTH domain
MEPFLTALGEVLRETRVSLGLSLREVAARSNGQFKAPSLACYERAERSLSLDRFCRLAAIYGVPPDRLLAVVLDRRWLTERRHRLTLREGDVEVSAMEPQPVAPPG